MSRAGIHVRPIRAVLSAVAIGILYSTSALASGSITGHVTSSTTLAGLQGTQIDVYDLNSDSDGPVASATTDSAGQYVVNLPDGTYAVLTQDVHGYINQIYPNIPCSATCDVNALVPIPVAGNAITGIDFVLEPGGRIAGTVTDRATGLGIAGVTVRILDAGRQVPFTTATTDAQGQFLSDGGTASGTVYACTANAGAYINQVYDNIPSAGCESATPTPFAVTIGVTTSGLNFALDVGGRISGRVTGPGAVALANIEVDVFDLSNNFLDAVMTDASGNYTSDALPSGTYHVATANTAGYVDKVFANVLCLGFCNLSAGTAVTVTPPATTANVNFSLGRGGTITGTARAAVGGAPIANANVSVFNSSGAFVGGTQTNASGVFSILVPPGTYFARTFGVAGFVDQLYNGISCPTGCNNVTAGTPLAVTADATLSNVNFTLAFGGGISGTVTNAANGTPLANVSVQALTSSGAFVTSINTDANGAYTIFGLAPGSYYVDTAATNGFVNQLYAGITCVTCNVTTSGGTLVSVAAGATAPNINFALTQGGRIAGHVTNTATGAGLANIQAQVYNAGGTFVGSVNTDASGNYTTPGLPAGTYFVRTSNNFGWIDQLYQALPCTLGGCNATITTGAPVVVVAAATTSGINFALTQGGRISGRVTNAATGAGIQNAQAKVYSSVGTFIGAAVTDASGNFTTAGLPADTYYMRADATGLLTQVYNGITCGTTCTVTAGAPLAVVAGTTTTNINFALVVGGSMTGTVTNAADATALVNVPVVVSNDGGFQMTVFTNSVGAYAVTGLVPGTYHSRVSAFQTFVEQAYNGVSCPGGFCAGSTDIVVAAGATLSAINFALTNGGRISGTVTAASGGAPLANVTIQVFAVGTRTLIGSVQTDGAGNYTTFSLPAGNYYVGTFNAPGFANRLYNGVSCPAGCSGIAGTPVGVSAGATTFNINFGLPPAGPSGSISGRVTSSTTLAGLQGTRLDVYDLNTDAAVASIMTDATGQYVVDLPDGTYGLLTQDGHGYINQIYPAIPCSATCNVNALVPVVVAGAAITGIDFVLDPGGRIAGMVTDRATGLGIPGVTIWFLDSGQQLPFTTATSDAQGHFLSDGGTSTGSVFACTMDAGPYIDQVYNNIPSNKCGADAGTPFAVTAGVTTSGLDFALDVGGRISGVVTGPGAAPLANIEVDVYDLSDHYLGATTTDASGTYTTDGLPAGSYRVETSNQAGYIDQVYTNVLCVGGFCNLSAGTAVTVTPPATTANVNFSLGRGGTITGTVRAAVGGAPIANANVSVFNSSGVFVGGTQTNTSGVFSILVPPGTYFARTFEVAGFVDQLYNGISCATGCNNVTAGTPLAVTADATLSNVNFTLAFGGGISGTVTSAANGTPLANVSVQALTSSGAFVTSINTDANGAYTIFGLAPGSYYVDTGATNGLVNQLYAGITCVTCNVTTSGGTVVSVAAGATVPNINFALAGGGVISGTVTNAATATPLANVQVQVLTTTGAFVTSTTTSATGAYTTFGLPPGSYYVRTATNNGFVNQLYAGVTCFGCNVTTSGGTLVPVAAGVTVPNINFALTRGGRISGRVTNAATGAGIQNAQAKVYDAVGTFIGAAVTDASGNFTTAGLPADTYYMRADATGFLTQVYNGITCGTTCTVTAGAPLAVVAGTTTANINFALDTGATITGTVTNAAGGAPLAGIGVWLWDANDRFVTGTATNASGVYTLTSLLAGTYFVRTSNTVGFVDQLYTGLPCIGFCYDPAGTPVVVAANATASGVNFALAAGGAISGTVTAAAGGVGLAQVFVQVYDAAGQFQTSTTTDASGNYTTAALPSGTHFVNVSNALGFVDQLYNGISCPLAGCVPTTGTPVPVTAPAATPHIDFALALGGTINGTVTAAVGGAPLSDLTIQIFSAGTGAFVGAVKTDASGNYSALGLAAGTYYVGTFSPPQGYANRLYNNVPCPASCAGVAGDPVAVVAGSATNGINISLPLAATAPTLTQPASRADAEDEVISLQLTSTNPNGGTLTYSAVNLPNGVTLNTASGLISGRLSFTSSGSYNVTVGVTDGVLSDSKSFTWTVTDVNRPPTLDPVLNRTDAAGRPVLIQLSGSDPDGTALSYGAANLPPGIAVDSASGAISGKPTGTGVFTVTATASDGVATATRIFTWTVVAATRGDFDRDGKAEITIFRPSTGVWWALQSHAGWTTSAGVDASGASGDVPVPGDYDGDGFTDLAMYRPSTGVWRVMLSSTGATVTTTLGAAGDVPVPGDYDADGKTDIAVFHKASGMWTVVLSSTGTTQTTTLGLRGDVAVPGDYDGDGVTDLAVYHRANGQWTVRRSSTNTTTTVTLPSGQTPVPGDYDGDGQTDPAVWNPTTGTWTVLESTTGTATTQTLGTSTDRAVPADYDGDGKTDLAVFGATGQWTIVLSNTGATVTKGWGVGTDVPVLVLPSVALDPPLPSDETRANDIDADGKSDVVVYRPGNGTWYVLKSQSNYTAQLSIAWGASGDIPVAGDYDGDGKPDLAVFRPSTGEWRILFSSTSYSTSLIQAWGGNGDLPVPGDYDGDGRTDIAVFHAATRQWKILYSTANYASGATVTWGGSTDLPVPADYDGDGRTDIAVFHRPTGEWKILMSSDGSTVRVVLGTAGDIPVAADYDGDGKADVAVFNKASGQWRILNSASGTTTTVTWGAIGDVPVPGDYDGDRKADLVVYRPGSGRWFGLDSHTSYTTQWNVAWGASSDHPGAEANVSNALTVQTQPLIASVFRAHDFDGDGKTDVAVYRPSSGAWYVLKSRTNYATQMSIAFGASTDIAVPGDYDGDGLADAAVFRPATGEWKIASSSTNYATTTTVVWGAAGDLPVPGDYDGDGRTDIAVFHPATAQWQILYAASNFTAGTTMTWGSRDDIPVPGDYDGDLVTDIAVYHALTGEWRILLSSTGYASSTTSTLGGGSDIPVPGDYDGDGKTDVAVFHRSTAQWQIVNSGTATTTTLAWGSANALPTPGDYDGDGKTDLAVYQNGQWQILSSASGTSLTLSWGTGTDVAGPDVDVEDTLTVQARPRASDISRANDYDGDGKSDITVYRPSNGTWYTVTSKSGYLGQTSVAWGTSTDVSVAGDYDGDGKTDPAFYRPSTNEWKILYSSTNFTTNGTFVLGSAGDLPVPGDYDGDGITDVAIFHPATGEWVVRLSSTGTVTTTVWGNWTDIPVPGDYDGDLVTDVAVFHPATGEWRIRYSSTGTGVSVAWGMSTDLPVPADYDGDGKTDVAVYHRATGQWQIVNSSTGTTTAIGWGASTDVPVPGDYDGDGKADLVVFRPGTGTWYVLQSHTGYATQFSVAWGSGSDRPGPNILVTNTLAVKARPRASDVTRSSDFDGDGRSDIAVFRPSDGTWRILNSLSNYTTQTIIPWGTSTDVPVPGDYDGDGRTDLAFYRPLTGEWHVLFAAANYTTQTTILWGMSGDVPVPGDYDGDGKSDIAVFRPSTGEWQILTSSSGFITAQTWTWGTSTDRPAPGDYDGDGKTDLAFFQPSTGQWQVALSTTNYATAVTVEWGAGSDLLVPGDYDGDGKTDAAVYRPSGSWFVLFAKNNFTTQTGVAWGASTDTPVVGDYDGDGKADFALFTPTGWQILLSGANYTTTVSVPWGLPSDRPLTRHP